MKLKDYATIVRSKNAGPFEITIDIMFEDKDRYEFMKENNIINKKLIQQLYQLDEKEIHHLVYFDSAQGIKVTFARKVSSGSINDRDVYGAQQASLLQELEIELE